MVIGATPQATFAGYDVLRAGGNAVDAAIAAIAVTSVVEASQCGLGGDCFAFVARPGEAPLAYNGSGRAPKGLSAERLLAAGTAEIARTSPHAVTVPGAVEAWCRLHADFGAVDLERLFAPAIAYAENGYVVQRRVAQDWAKGASLLATQENAARFYLRPDGTSPVAGSLHHLPGLATAFRDIAANGADGFYRGRVAEDIVTYLRALGGFHESADFADHRGQYVEPISRDFRGHQVYECPPNGQGVAALIILGLLERLLGSDTLDSAQGIHLLAEASKIAFAVRDELVADPDVAPMDVERWLSQETIAELATKIDRAHAGTRPTLAQMMPAHEDTSYVTVVDRDGLAVSLISSIFSDFGSTLVEPRSGILLQNRGAGFKVAPGHPNCVAPGKRPLHTIIPGMVMKDGRPSLSFGVVGGHYQPVGHAMVLHAMLTEGLDPQEALNRPRSLCQTGPLELETTNSPELARELERLGHRIVRPAHPLGGGHVIQIDHERGVLVGASDPRRDGVVAGF
ncbi:gamma-glutamyltransferase [Afifella sp. IM 167]|nr:gamma-glutamyltransferase [Afifella sp. IM 167]